MCDDKCARKMKDTLYLIVPCFNEEELICQAATILETYMDNLIQHGVISKDSRILFVDDGSKDQTWHKIKTMESPRIHGIRLSKNRGHQNALLAGMMTAKEEADMIISIDADLQDDIEVMDQMIEKYYSGCDIVYGVRNDRSTDRILKRVSAQTYYRILKWLGTNVIYNHADFRLLSKLALEELSEYSEVNLFLRGIIPELSDRTDVVYYKRKERIAGKSKYSLKKMLTLAWNGITSFSIKPIKMIRALGLLMFIISIFILIFECANHFNGNTVHGWTSLIVSIWAIGGLNLFAIGILGEYIGKIYLETKSRPKYYITEYKD